MKVYDKVKIKGTNDGVWLITSFGIELSGNDKYKIDIKSVIIKSLDSNHPQPLQEHSIDNLELFEENRMTDEEKVHYAKIWKDFLL